MTRETYIVANSMVTIDPNHKSKTVTLAALPGLPTQQLDRHETAPRLLPVRGQRVKPKLSHAAQERAFDRAADAVAAKIAGLGVLAQVVL